MGHGDERAGCCQRGGGKSAFRNTPVDSVDVVLSEPISPASFNYQALSLTLDGGANLINSGVTVTEITPTTFSIGGLGSLTTADGTYDLTVSAGGLVDGLGNSGVGFLSETWTMSTVGPTIASLPTYIQIPRNIIVPTIDVIFSEPIVPTSFTYQNLIYAKPGEPDLITPNTTITRAFSDRVRDFQFQQSVAPPSTGRTRSRSAPVGVEDLYGNTGTGSIGFLDTDHDGTGGPDGPGDLAEHDRLPRSSPTPARSRSPARFRNPAFLST